jgi:hypothetical protein
VIFLKKFFVVSGNNALGKEVSLPCVSSLPIVFLDSRQRGLFVECFLFARVFCWALGKIVLYQVFFDGCRQIPGLSAKMEFPLVITNKCISVIYQNKPAS